MTTKQQKTLAGAAFNIKIYAARLERHITSFADDPLVYMEFDAKLTQIAAEVRFAQTELAKIRTAKGGVR
jgi:hypothetical protein